MKQNIAIAIRLLCVLTLMTGFLYPLMMTLFASAVFPSKAGGSLIERHGTTVGSGLIGQLTDSSVYFHNRPSAAAYTTLPSGASNASPTNQTLQDSMAARRKRFTTENGIGPGTSVPLEMISASASGLDPHISPDAALLQVDRVAKARGFDSLQRRSLELLVRSHIEPPQFGFLGQARVNVLQLNLAIDMEKGFAASRRP
ncbi:MAG TPA: potassium-transporting ATPase subunit KdpC [Bacteroidota bacterium]|nr:potassium-transporting ATPase subunit KdpC [Bacteroidota bacterium]